MGFGLAVMPMVAMAAAQNTPVQVRRVTRMGLWLGVFYAALAVPLFWFSGPVLIAAGQEVDLSDMAQHYLRIAGLGILPAVVLVVLRSFLSALEHTRIALWATMLGVVMNAGINWVLIFGRYGLPELGLTGAAIASLATNVIICISLGLYAALHRDLRPYALFIRFWRSDPEAFVAVFRLGWPIGLTLLAESGLFTASTLMIGWMGEITLAAHGIVLQIASVAFMMHIGLSQAATIRAGQAWGRGDRAQLRLAGLAVVICSLIAVVVTVIVFFAIPHMLVGAFIGADDPARPAILAIGITLVYVAALFQLADAAQVIALGLLRGAHDTRMPMIIAIISYWIIGLGAAYALGFHTPLAEIGVWFGLVIGLAAAALLLMIRFWVGPGRAASA